MSIKVGLCFLRCSVYSLLEAARAGRGAPARAAGLRVLRDNKNHFVSLLSFLARRRFHSGRAYSSSRRPCACCFCWLPLRRRRMCVGAAVWTVCTGKSVAGRSALLVLHQTKRWVNNLRLWNRTPGGNNLLFCHPQTYKLSSRVMLA